MLPEVECIGYVGKALDFTRDGLVPFIEAQLKRRCPDTWHDDLSSLFTSSNPIDPDNPPWDAFYALKALAVPYFWERVFSFCMSPTHRGYAFELAKLRNKQQAHGQRGTTLTEEDAHRSLDNAVLLLTAIGATEQASEAAKLRGIVRRAIAQHEESQPVGHSTQTGSLWSYLLLQAVGSAAIRIIPIESVGLQAATRALGPIVAKESFERTPRFAQNVSVRIELDIKLANIEVAQPLYCFCLVVDAEQITCLCPHPAVMPDPRIRWPTFKIPAPKEKQPLVFYGATGLHTIYAVLTKKELPTELYELFIKPQPIEILDEISTGELGSAIIKILKTTFIVE